MYVCRPLKVALKGPFFKWLSTAKFPLLLICPVQFFFYEINLKIDNGRSPFYLTGRGGRAVETGHFGGSVAIFGHLSRIWLLSTPFGYQNFLFGYLSFSATFLATFRNW